MSRSAILCPNCGAIESPKSEKCYRCGATLGTIPAGVKIVSGLLKNELFSTRFLQTLFTVHFIITLGVTIYLGGNIIEAFAPGDNFADSLLFLGAIKGSLVYQGELFRLVTAIFAHYGILHLVFNSMAVGAVAPETERNVGRTKLFIIFLAGGTLANLVSLLWHGPRLFQVGASGAICALIGALYMIAKLRSGFYGEIVRRVVTRWIVLTLLFGFLVPGVDNAAHIAGMIFGAVIVKIFGIKN